MRLWVFIILLGTQVAGATDLPLVGLDRDGNPVELFVKKEKYQKQMTEAIDGVQTSALPVLEKHEKSAPWSLRTIVVGIGLSVQVGIGPIIKLTAAPRFRALFSNSNDPVIP